MSDLRQFSRKFIAEIIEIYKSHPCLWKVKCKDYSNRKLKTKAYDVLIKKFRQVDETCDRETVVKKFNSLRSCYRKELKKIEASILSGATGDDVYKPHLWYFEQLSFLRNQEEELPNESIWNIEDLDYVDSSNAQDNVESEMTSGHSTPQRPEMEDSRPTFPTTTIYPYNLQNVPKIITPKRKIPYEDNFDLPMDHLPPRCEEDKFDLAGKTWAATLRTVTRDQQIYAEKIINDVLFEAQLGNLGRESQLVCFKQHI